MLAGVSTIQIVSYPRLGEYEKLLSLLPTTQLAQVTHVEDESTLDLIEQYAPYVDVFLLDSGRPSLATPEYGGTGRTRDWSISSEFLRRSPLTFVSCWRAVTGECCKSNERGAASRGGFVFRRVYAWAS